jgi:pyrophosphatase PpaX
LIKGVLFDFDGTLADTIELIVASFEHTCFTTLGLRPERQAIINTIGLPLADAFVLLTGREDLVGELRRVYGEFNEANHDRMIKPISGVHELLRELRQRDLKLAVVTSKKPHMVRRGMDCLGITPYIDSVVTVLDTPLGKPHPQPMLLACERLELRPEECLCVGDSPFDMQSGNAAGNITVAVEYTALDWQTVLATGKPNYTIARPQELLRLIEKLNAKEEINA